MAVGFLLLNGATLKAQKYIVRKDADELSWLQKRGIHKWCICP